MAATNTRARARCGANGSKRRSFLSKLRLFRRRDDGSAAVEFALLALPFFALVMFTFELGLGFVANKVLEIGTDTVARQIRVGQLQLRAFDPDTAGDEEAAQREGMAEFREALCDQATMTIFFDCSKLLIDVQMIATWANAPGNPGRDETTDSEGNVKLGSISSSGFNFAPGGRQSINVVRVFYEWPTIMNFNDSESYAWVDDKRLMMATAAFVNEPF